MIRGIRAARAGRAVLGEALDGAGSKLSRLVIGVIGTAVGVAALVLTVGLGQTAAGQVGLHFDSTAATHVETDPSRLGPADVAREIAAVVRDQAAAGEGPDLVLLGNDAADSGELRTLRRQGVTAYLGHDASHVDEADILVSSMAVPLTHPEILAAEQQGKPALRRIELLARLLAARRSVAVTSRRHGRTRADDPAKAAARSVKSQGRPRHPRPTTTPSHPVRSTMMRASSADQMSPFPSTGTEVTASLSRAIADQSACPE